MVDDEKDRPCPDLTDEHFAARLKEVTDDELQEMVNALESLLTDRQ